MKKISSLTMAALAAGLFSQVANAADEYIWTPTYDQSGTAGGSGVWNYNNRNWWSSTLNNALAYGTADNPFAKTNDVLLHFYGSGTITKTNYVYFSDQSHPTTSTLMFHEGANYVISPEDSVSRLNYHTGPGDFVLDVAPSSTLSWQGKSSALRLSILAGGTSASGGRLVMQGGGVVNGNAYFDVRAGNPGMRWVIRGDTTVNMNTNSVFDAIGALGRVFIESGTLNTNAYRLYGGYNTALTAPDPEQGFGFALGASPGASPAVMNITAGSVYAYGDPRAVGASYGGIVFGLAATDRGGVLAMSGGSLHVTGIRSNTEHDVMNLSGVTINVITDLAANSAHGTATDGERQSRLDNFITGFSGVGDNFINLAGGNIIFDLSLIDITKTNGTATIDSAIRGPGQLRMTGTNRTLVLKGTNSFASATVLSGTLAGNTDSLPANIQRNAAGTLVFDQDFDGTYSGSLTGSGPLAKRGSGLLDINISSTNSLQGRVRIDAGALQLSGEVGLYSLYTPDITNSSTLLFNPSVTSTYANIISGTGNVIKKGGTTLTLSGNNTYTGKTIVESGTLLGGLSSIKGDFSITGADATLGLIMDAGGTYSGTIDGTGVFQKRGGATLTLAGDSSGFAGTMHVATGTLIGDTRSLAGIIQRDAAAAVVFDQDFDGSFSGALTGAGDIRKTGTGAIIIRSSAGGAPAVFVDNGRLLLNGANAFMGGGTTTIAAGAAAGGSGKFATLIAGTGATVQIGGDNQSSAETLTVSDRLTVGDATLLFDLFDNNTSDYINANAVTNNGGNIIEIGAFATGTFMLGPAATGTLAGSTVMIDGLLVGAGSRRNGTLTDNGGLQLVTTAANSLVATWTGTTSGTWNATHGNWDSDALGLFAVGDKVVFDDTVDASPAAARAIEVVSPGVRVSDMLASGTGDYTFTGAGITTDATEAIGLTGATGKLIKTGAGTLTLDNGANDFRGGVELGGGVLALGAGASLGTDTLAVTAADTTLRATGGVTLGNALALAAHGLTVDTGAGTLALSGNISGASTIIKTGAGELVLSGGNDFAGVDLASGTLAVAHATAAGNTLKAAGAGVALRFAADGIALASALDLSAHGLNINTDGRAASLAGALTGAGALAKTGAGTLALTADNGAFTGEVAVGAGAVQIASFSNLGAGDAALTIAADAALLFRQTAAADVTLARALKGAGTLDVALAGAASRFAFAASAGSEFTGTVALGQGAISLDAGNMAALANATLVLNNNSTATIENTGGIAGLDINGGVIKIEMNTAGTVPVNKLTVGHLNVMSGTVAINLSETGSTPIINPGSPSIFDQSQLSEIKLIDATTVTGAGVQLALVKMDGSAYAIPMQINIEQSAGAGSEVVGTADYNHIVQAAGDGLYLGSGLTRIDIHENKTLILDNAGASTPDFKAQLTGAGGVEIRATGTVTLSNAENDFTGTAALASGVLKLTRENALANAGAVTLAAGAVLDTNDISQELANPAGAGDIIIGAGTLTLRATADTEYDGGIEAATGRLIKTGTGATRLGGASAFAGGVDVRAGTLRLSGGAAGAAASFNINAGAALAFENTVRDFAGAITGGGALAFVNSQARLGAANTLSAVALSDGAHVRVADAGALGGAAAGVTVASGATLELLSPATATMTAAAGAVVVDGGKLLFGANTTLNAAKTVSFINHGAIGLAGPVQTDVYTLITTGSGLTSDNPATLLPDYNPGEFGMGVHVARDGKNLVMEVYNQAANPAKDVAMARDTVLAALSAVYSRVSETLLMPLADRGQKRPARDFWIKGFGTIGDYEQTPMQIGFTDRTQGLVAGYDRVLGDKLLLGAWAGIASGELKTTNLAQTNADQQLFGAYSALKLGRWHAGVDVAGGFMQADTSRNEYAGVAEGYYETIYMAASAELGFVLGSWNRGAVRPSASIHYMNLHYKDQWEKGAGAVLVEDFTHDFVQSFVKLRATQGFDLPLAGWPAVIDVSAGWRQNLSGGDCPVRLAYVTNPGTRIEAEAGGYVRGSAVLGLGFRMAITRIMSFGLDYDFEVAAARQRHTASAAIRWNW
jgi:autotransporter-associated beta strand protein